MCAIDAVTIKCSEVQFRSRQSDVVAPPTPLALSTSTPSTFEGGVTLDVIMVQFQCMDARLDTITIEMFQVNTCVGRIARWQAHLGGFMESSSPPPEASVDDDEDGDANSSSGDEMSA